MFGGYSETKLKPTLKMAVSRFNMAANKKTALMKQQMREIAKLLDEDPPKEEKARIRAEALIRDDGVVEAYEILQLSCELLSERIKLISASKTCPEDLVSTVATLMWASTRVDIKELIDVRKQFKAKFGKKFDASALNNEGGILNERVVAKLSIQPPTAYLVQTYLEKIADQFGVHWEAAQKLSAENLSSPMVAPVGYSVQVAPATGLAPTSSFPPPQEAYPVSGSAVGGQQSDDVSEMGNTSASILSGLGRGGRGTDQNDDENHTGGFGGNGGGDIPVAEVMAPAAGSVMQEVDIYIPPAPQQAKEDIYIPPAPGAKSTSSNDNNDNNNDDNDRFEDLQSRFAKLKR